MDNQRFLCSVIHTHSVNANTQTLIAKYHGRQVQTDRQTDRRPAILGKMRSRGARGCSNSCGSKSAEAHPSALRHTVVV